MSYHELTDLGEHQNAPNNPTVNSSHSSLETPLDDSLEGGSLETPPSSSPIHMAFMNMSNSILGAGIIGQAYAVHSCGLAAAVAIYIVITIVVDWTIRLVVINCKLAGASTFQATAGRCFGAPGHFGLLAAQGVFALGGSIAFCIIIGDTVPHVLQNLVPSAWRQSSEFVDFLVGRKSVIVILTCFVSYPLSLSGNIASLALSSLFALINMAAIITIVVVKSIALGTAKDANYQWSSWFGGHVISSSLFQGASVISFAMVCHHNTSFIYDSLRKPTLDRFAKLTHWSCGVSMLCCMLVGIVGDSMFKDSTKGNLLNNFPQDDWLINLARLCFGMNMLTTFPLEIFVVRQVVLDLLGLFKNRSNYEALEEHEPSFNKQFVTTTVLVFSTMFVSLLTCNLGATLELVGSVSASIMAFIFPCLCNLKLTNYKQKSFRQNFPSYATIILGLSILVISSSQTIYKAIHGEAETCAA